MAQKKVTDIIVEFIVAKGVKHAFGVPGGAVLHLIDSMDRHPSITPVFNHHEQASAFAAQAYARVAGVPGVCFVTTGPGGTNAITGLLAAWLDSIPAIYISGQARHEHLSRHKGIRQRGVQEYDIISVVQHMTKKAVMLENAEDIYDVLEECYSHATTGRPGPVWIDLPLNLQWVMVPERPILSFSSTRVSRTPSATCMADAKRVAGLLAESRRPLVLIGNGIRLGGAIEEFSQLMSKLSIPCIASWNAGDLVPTDEAAFIGRPGVFGQRGANMAMQNCDLLLALGSHLAVPVTGTQFPTFAREARVVAVDLDAHEIGMACVHIDVPIVQEVGDFMVALRAELRMPQAEVLEPWRQRCLEYKGYNGITERRPENGVDPYVFVDRLSDMLKNDEAIVIDGGGTCNQIAFQSLRTKAGQRIVISGALCSMGSGLPDSIGVAFQDRARTIVCFIGDGSFQFNVQELQTIRHHGLKIKIFVFCNSGYLSIRQTQNAFFGGRHIGSGEQGGLSLPDVQKVAEAYGIPCVAVLNTEDLGRIPEEVLAVDGPVLCMLRIPVDSPVEPTIGFVHNENGTASPRPLEDMMPFLDRDEFARVMCIKPPP
jgi:acetolactate synthase-1/2/3 large subunit